MDARDSGGPRPSMQMQMQASFGAYYHRGGAGGGGGGGGGGYSVGSSSPPSVIHAPAAMRHTSSQPLPVASTPTPTPADTPTHIIPHQVSFSPAPGMGMGMGLSSSDPVKRKRGRPRKYVTDANGIPLRSSPLTPGIASPQEKRGRGSGKKAQSYGLGATGQAFTPHVLTIAAGEDVAIKIMSFLQHAPWAVCILSANGAVSNATLRHAGISGGAVTYEGRFEILSLSGSFLLTESAGTRSRTGGLSVSLAGPDGRVIGGGVAGLLMAATPVQVIVGTFFPEGRKNQVRVGSGEATSGTQPVGTTAGTLSVGPVIQHTCMEATGSIQGHMSGAAEGDNEEHHHVSHVMPLQSIDWGGSQFDVETRDDAEPLPSSPGGS